MRQLKITNSLTNRSDASIDKYFQDISKKQMISVEREIELAQIIRTAKGKERDLALQELVEANLRFVISVAKQYQNQGMTLSDLINEGNIGLIKAADKFDETRGFKFISYAVWWVRQSIMQAIAENKRMVRLPINQVNLQLKIKKFQSEFEHTYERTPTITEISEGIEEEIHKVKEMISAGNHMSYDSPFGPEDNGTLLDVLPDNNSLPSDSITKKDSLVKDINRALETLTERESFILKSYFGLNGNAERSLDEISVDLGITRERVRQIREKALRRLKSSSRGELIKQYL